MSKTRLDQMAAFRTAIANKKSASMPQDSGLSASDTSAPTGVPSNGNVNLFNQIEELNKKFESLEQKNQELDEKNQALAEALKTAQEALKTQSQETQNLIKLEQAKLTELVEKNKVIETSLKATQEETSAQGQQAQKLIEAEHARIEAIDVKNKSLEEALKQVTSDSNTKIEQITQHVSHTLSKHTTSLTTAFEEHKKETVQQIQKVDENLKQTTTDIQSSVGQLQTKVDTTSEDNRKKFEDLFQAVLEGDLEQISSQTLITELRDKLSDMGLELDEINNPLNLTFKYMKLTEAQEKIKSFGDLGNLVNRIDTLVIENTKSIGGQEILDAYLSILNSPQDLDLETIGDSSE